MSTQIEDSLSAGVALGQLLERTAEILEVVKGLEDDMATFADNVLAIQAAQEQLAAAQAALQASVDELKANQVDVSGIEPHLDTIDASIATVQAAVDETKAAAIASKDIDTQVLEQLTPTPPPSP